MVAPIATVVACGSAPVSNDRKTQATSNSVDIIKSSDGHFDDGLYRSKRPISDYPKYFKIDGLTAYKMWSDSDSKYLLEYFDKYNGKVDFSIAPWTESVAYEAIIYGIPDKFQNRKHFIVNRYEVYDFCVSKGWNYHYLTK